MAAYPVRRVASVSWSTGRALVSPCCGSGPAAIAVRAATLASDRSRSSRSSLATTIAIPIAIARDNAVTAINTVSITHHDPTRLSILRISSSSPELELDRDFDDHVDRRPEPPRRRKPPLTHRVRGALVEPAPKPLQDPNVADRSVAAHDDLEDDITGKASPAGLLCVIRFDFALHGRGRDPASRTIRTAPRATTGSCPYARAVAFTQPSASSGSSSTAGTRTLARTVLRCLRDDACDVANIRRGCRHRRNHLRHG